MGFKKKYFPFNSCYASLSKKSYLITNDILLERELLGTVEEIIKDNSLIKSVLNPYCSGKD